MTRQIDSIRSRITQYVRSQINEKKWAPGYVIPNTAELAAMFGTQLSNAHRALLPLLKEGLISRKTGCGTIVNQPEEIKTVAVSIFREKKRGISAFRRKLTDCVVEELLARGIVSKIIYLSDNTNEVIEELNEFEAAGKIQGAILAVPWDDIARANDRLKIPCSFLSRVKSSTCVSIDSNKSFEKLMAHLQETGRTKLAFLGSIIRKDFLNQDHDSPLLHDLTSHLRIAEKYHIDLPEQFLILPDKLEPNPYARVEYAYQAVKQLFSRKNHPNALYVSSDDLLPGVIFALLEKNIRVPKDLELICMKNKELSQFAPFPITYLELSIQKLALALVDQLTGQMEGKRASNITIETKLIIRKEFGQS